MPTHYDPKAYRARCVPRPREQAADSISKFWEGLIALANEHKIADVTVCARVHIVEPARDLIEDEERESVATSVGHIGDPVVSAEMAAYANGFLRAELNERLARQLAAGERYGRKA